MSVGSYRHPTADLAGGKYRILRRLAVGGMAEIFLAEATNIHGFRKKVVIKRILPQLAHQAEFVEMFLDEARLVARLNHAAIVQVFDIGEEEDGVFFTMEYIEGFDLSDVLTTCYKKNRPLSFEEVVAIVVPMAEALHHAHELQDDHGRSVNLIHRDVTPSNIIVTKEGRVKLLDFGVAKSSAQLRETTGVSLKGKFGYMAPEQIEGVPLDRRSDIFSFGVVLWELLTGVRLFPGGNEPSVLHQITTQTPALPSTIRSGLPAEFDRICKKALARDREHRYNNLHDLILDIEVFAQERRIVGTSRSLARMVKDLFQDQEPTQRTIPPDIGKPGVHRSLMAPGFENTASVTPLPVKQQPAKLGSIADGGHGFYNSSSTYEVAYEVPPTSRRKLYLVGGLGLVAALAAVFFFLKSGNNMKEASPGERIPAVEAAPASIVPTTIVEPKPNDLGAAAAALNPEAALDPEAQPAVDPDAQPAVDPDIRPVLDPDAENIASKPEPIKPPVEVRSKRNRSKVKRRSQRSKPTEAPKPKAWDPDSPFAPEF